RSSSPPPSRSASRRRSRAPRAHALPKSAPTAGEGSHMTYVTGEGGVDLPRCAGCNYRVSRNEERGVIVDGTTTEPAVPLPRDVEPSAVALLLLGRQRDPDSERGVDCP